MTKPPIELHPEAALEGQEAAAWYFRKSSAAAEAFLVELDETIEKISEGPEVWAEFQPGLRRVLFKRFPFSLVYRIYKEKIQIIAIAHARRRPGYWKLRSA